jgi:RimJ/RimL family protein N-acetyltransferase
MSPDIRVLAREVRRAGVRRSVARLLRSIRRHGLRTALRRAEGVGASYWWHRLDLDAIGSRDLPQGIELRRAGVQDLPLYEQLAPPAVNVEKAPEWLAEGNDLWLAVEESRTAFGCWTYRRRMPMGEAAGGWLRLPSGVAFLEHSLASPDFRGRGVAPASWSLIARQMAAEGESTLMTKVGEENEVTQRSLAKIGFRRADPDDPVVRDFQPQLGR